MRADPRSWPFGDELRAHRERVRLSIRTAAAKAGISEGRWRQLESGYQSVGGEHVPINTTPKTVVKVAKVVLLPAAQALALAGFDPEVHMPHEHEAREDGDHYTVRVHVDESGEMWAAVSELPGCFAAGSSWSELGESIGAGIDLYTRASDRLASR